MIELTLYEIAKIDQLRLIHMFICFFGALLLFFIVIEGRKENKQNENLTGLIFVSLALLMWVSIDFYRYSGFMVAGSSNVILKTFSAYNNAFFLASLPFFEQSFTKLKNKIPLFKTPFIWASSIIVLNIFIVMFYSISWGDPTQQSPYVKNFDVIYSSLTIFGLGLAITNSFFLQKMRLFAFISIFIFTLLIATQISFSTLFKIKFYDFISIVALFSQTLMIMLLVILAILWKSAEKIKDDLIVSNDISSDNVLILEKNEILEKLIIEKDLIIKDLTDKIKDFEVQIEINNNSNQIKELSDRELEVLKLMDNSYTVIGEMLFISRDTVISHKKNIESKLQISGKDKLTEYAIEKGLIKKEK